jgi:hypothetical protein
VQTCCQIVGGKFGNAQTWCNNNTRGKFRKNAKGRWCKKKHKTKLHLKLALIFYLGLDLGMMKTSSSPNMWEKNSHSKLLFDIWFPITQESHFLVGASLVHVS